MEYHGKLYGKVGGEYFDTGSTSDDYDNLEEQVKALQAEIDKLKSSPRKIAIIGHCGVGVRATVNQLLESRGNEDFKLIEIQSNDGSVMPEPERGVNIIKTFSDDAMTELIPSLIDHTPIFEDEKKAYKDKNAQRYARKSKW